MANKQQGQREQRRLTVKLLFLLYAEYPVCSNESITYFKGTFSLLFSFGRKHADR